MAASMPVPSMQFLHNTPVKSLTTCDTPDKVVILLVILLVQSFYSVIYYNSIVVQHKQIIIIKETKSCAKC